MSFMNAKEARPVDDPKALVPFGWAPGGYHCAACSACGEAHGGSDKRSMRCQDCAEALRDKQAAEHALTPRETADHAELEYYGYRAFNAGIGCCHLVANPGLNDTNPEPLVTAASAKALLSEIAALRGELKSIEINHDIWVEIAEERQNRATQAERQRDEAVGLLKQFHTRIMMERRCNSLGVNVAEPIMEKTRAFLANQGAE